MSFPLKLDVVSSKDVKSKKRWKHVQWDGEESENVSLLGSKTLAQFDLVTGKKRRVDASLRRVLGEVVCITGSLSGAYIVGLRQDGNLFRWRKNTRAVTNIGPCPDFNASTGQSQGPALRKVKLFVSDDGSTILLFSHWHGIRLWRSIGHENSGWTNINVGCASAILTSKGVAVDSVFYNDEVIGKQCRCAFASFSGNHVSVAVLFLKYEENESAQNYAFHKYPLTDFHPPLLQTSYRDALIPCWSRNGSTLAVAVNQRRPSTAKIFLIHPISGGLITVSFADILESAVDMSFWITGLSWTADHLFLACVTRQGAVSLISANGFVMKVVAQSPAENFGPGTFLPLEGFMGFRRPAVHTKYPDMEDSTDTSMQSTVLPPKKRNPHYSISMHPTLKLLLCADGYSVAVMKLADNVTHADLIVSGLADVVLKIWKIINCTGLQVNVLEPLSYFLPVKSDKAPLEKEERWRTIVRTVRVRLFPDGACDVNGDETIEKSPEQLALISALMEDLDESQFNQSVGRENSIVKDDSIQVEPRLLVHHLKSCHSTLLSTLALMKIWSSQNRNENVWNAAPNGNQSFTKEELMDIYVLAFKLHCDILLQVQDIADILPDDIILDTKSSPKRDTLRKLIASYVSSLGNGVLSLIRWTDLSTPMSLIVPRLVVEVVRSTLSCAASSSEGCISGRDMKRNVRGAFQFLLRAEDCLADQSRRHTDVVFGVVRDEGVPDRHWADVKFLNAWRLLYKVTTKAFPKADQFVSHLQKRLSENVVLPAREMAAGEIKATKPLSAMCENLGQYRFAKCLSLAYEILCALILRSKKWTAEKWLPVEVLGRTMSSYFTGCPVFVPSLTAAISKIDAGNDVYYHSLQLQQRKITAAIRSQSLDDSWTLNNAVLLLLSCGQINDAAQVASDAGDWRTSFVLYAIAEKVYYLPKYAPGAELKRKTDALLRKRYEDILTSIVGVKVGTNADCVVVDKKSDVKFFAVNPVPYYDSLRDLLELSAMVGYDVTTTSTCALLNTIKSVCLQKLYLHVPVDFKLPRPQLFLPQSHAQNLTPETKFRHEISAYVRILLAVLHCAGIQRSVALWYLKRLDKQSSVNLDEASKKSFSAEIATLKDVTLQGLELDSENCNGSTADFEVYFLAAAFREICAILWFFHLRDKVAVSLRRYQSLREELYDPRCDNGFVNQVDVESMYGAIYECIVWVEKLVPFAKFFQFNSEMEEIILCLVAELPMCSKSVGVLARFFFRESTISARNSHRLQSLLQKMRKSESDDNSGTTLSSVFERECRKHAQNADCYSGHFHAPKHSNFTRSGVSMSSSQADTLTRDEASVKSKLSPDETFETLQTRYLFESDKSYHEFVFHFLEIALSKSPASGTYTPKKNGSKSASLPMRYPLVLSYRSEIARMNLEVISQPANRDDASLSLKVPVIGEDVSTVLGSNEKSDVSGVEESAVGPWRFFKMSHKSFDPNTVTTRLENRRIPRISLKDLPAPFRKKIQRLTPYFEWLEHWRVRVVTMPRNPALDRAGKAAMRVTVGAELIFHAFTIAEMRFGKLGRARKGGTRPDAKPETIKAEADHDATDEDVTSAFTSEAAETVPEAVQSERTDNEDESAALPQESGDEIPDNRSSTPKSHSQQMREETETTMQEGTESPIKENIEEERNSQPKPDEQSVPMPPSGQLDDSMHRETDEEPQNTVANEMSQSVTSANSTGLQSDIIADGGGKVYPPRPGAQRQKEELKDVVRTEIQNAMMGQQVLFLAQMFQSAMLQASGFLAQNQHQPTRPEPVRPYPNSHPASTRQKHDDKLKMLNLSGKNEYVEQKSLGQKPKRPPLRLLTENASSRKTQYLHDENANAPKLFPPRSSRPDNSDFATPLLHKPKTAVQSNHKHHRGSMGHHEATMTPTTDVQPQPEQLCPTCESRPPSRMTVKLPLLNMANSIASKSQRTQNVNAVPKLIRLRQILRYEQKRMDVTGERSQSVVPAAKALPLLGADKIPGFYKQMPSMQQRLATPSLHRPSEVREQAREPPAKPIPAWKDSQVPEPENEEKIEIPKELIPKVLTDEDAVNIRNSVLAHYKTIVDHEKLMWREAGQQTEDVDNRVDTGVGPIEMPEQRPPRLIPSRADRHDAHEQFVDKFLDPERNRVHDLDRVPVKELKARDITQMQHLEDEMKIPTVQNLVRSRFQSAMGQMSSEIAAVGEMHRELHSRIPVYDEPVDRTASSSSTVHFAPSMMAQNIRRSTTPTSPSSPAMSRTEDSVGGYQAYLPPSDLIGEMARTYDVEQRLSPSRSPRSTENRGLEELSRYRKRIDEAFSLAEYGPPIVEEDRHSDRLATPTSSIHRMDEGSLLSSLSWNELEAMVNGSLLSEAETDYSIPDAVDERMRDAMQLLHELQSEKPNIPPKTPRITSRQLEINKKKSKKRNADVDARIDDAMGLLNEIKTDHNQIKRGKYPTQNQAKPEKRSTSKSKPMDNWTMKAMSLLEELKDEYRPGHAKENLPPGYFGATDPDHMFTNLEEAMALLQDNDDRSSSSQCVVSSSHVSFQPESQMPKRYY